MEGTAAEGQTAEAQKEDGMEMRNAETDENKITKVGLSKFSQKVDQQNNMDYSTWIHVQVDWGGISQ